MTPVRLGAVEYLNTRPLVYGLEREADFTLRFDVPSRCAELLHAGEIDLGLIPSIEYLRGDSLSIVPGLAIASRGAVASVAIFTTRDIRDVRSIALDTSSRTSVALVSVLCARAFHIAPELTHAAPDIDAMLGRADAALIIGDNALFQPAPAPGSPAIQKIDLGSEWLRLTALPFVYAFWAGRSGALMPGHVRSLQQARDAGVSRIEDIAQVEYPGSEARQAIAVQYLRDNIKYDLGAEERAGLERFYSYAAEAGAVPASRPLQFF